jgi:putative transposase
MTTKVFNFSELEARAMEQLRAGKSLLGSEGALTPLIKHFTEAALRAELDAHLSNEQSDANRKNGKTTKSMRSGYGSFELDTPRDRSSSFEPQLVKKRQTLLTKELEDKVISLYGLGSSYSGIRSHIEEIYGIDISEATVSAVTDKLLPEIDAWRTRSLDSVYPIVWMDAMFFKIREEGHVKSKPLYSLMGLNQCGQREILGVYVCESEGAKFWLSVLTDLKERGVKDILIACVDGLKGFPEAINSIFPDTQIQLCIVHQIRNSLKYVVWKEQKSFMADLKLVYQAVNIDSAEHQLDILEEKWGKKYPHVIRSWRNNWEHLSGYFLFSEPIRKVIYTTNIIEGYHRQIRKVTKSKGAFSSEKGLLKLVYLVTQRIEKKRSVAVRHWNLALAQLDIHFPGRLELNI